MMNSSHRPIEEIDGIRLPGFLYGTAWKEDQTERLTRLALEEGFRGVDTANQRKHYDEASVGLAIRNAIKDGIVRRDDLFLQTKFTFQDGQDHRLPYDPKAPIPIQVEQSFASSLDHLGTERIESYVLHGPTHRIGLTSADWAAWHAMEAIHVSGRARLLGVSNVSLEQLKALCLSAKIPPRFVQNRCYAIQAWDRDVRQFCSSRGIVYQGFSLLTANRAALADPELVDIAKRHGRTVCQIVFRFAADIGMLPLTGTTNSQHMREDLNVVDWHLSGTELDTIENLVSKP